MRFWPRRRPARAVKPVSSFRPRLEALEDRCVPAIDMVTNLSGSAATPGSLPNWVANAAAGDTIQFAANLNGDTITLGNTLDISNNLSIDGVGSGITVNGGHNRVFLIEAGVAADINALTITGGFAPGGGRGGGIYNQGFLSLSNSTVTGNLGAVGGGIGNDGQLTIFNCTIAANVAYAGGGIANFGVLRMGNSTVASNTVGGGPAADAGGIFTFGAGSELDLLNTIVFNPNSGAATHNDVYGTQVAQAQGDLFGSAVTIASGGDLGGNQFNANPLLGPLQNNGGPTATMALVPGSPAIGAGAGASLIPGLSVPTTDQRGEPRAGNSIDVGAFQTEQAPPLGFVQDLYHDFLGRDGTPSELNQWVSVLPTLGQSAVAYAISHSAEALTHAVDGFYVQFLGRAAVGGEEAGWVAALQHGATEEQVIAGILSSSEFAAHANALIGGANADANYVQALYQVLLSRTGSPTEANAWLGTLPSGRAAVALGFLGGAEYRTDMVDQYYATLLDRGGAPAASEAAGWVNSSLDMLAMEAGFASSMEYFQNG
jgi:hypothetical protein